MIDWPCGEKTLPRRCSQLSAITDSRTSGEGMVPTSMAQATVTACGQKRAMPMRRLLSITGAFDRPIAGEVTAPPNQPPARVRDSEPRDRKADEKGERMAVRMRFGGGGSLKKKQKS